MKGFPFNATVNSTGSADAITLPQDFPSGICTIVLKPPVGHAWDFYGPGTAFIALGMDEPLTLGPAYHEAGETIGYGDLDSGSGTLRGIAS